MSSPLLLPLASSRSPLAYVIIYEREIMRVETRKTKIQELLGLPLSPVAISFQEHPPTGIPRIEAPLPAGCAYWREAANGRVFYTEASDHFTCPIGAHTHGVELPEEVEKELYKTIEMVVGIQYMKLEEIRSIPSRPQKFGVAMYAPLEHAAFPPDVVLVRGNVKQLMLLAEAAQAVGVAGGGTTLGRPTCAILPESLSSQQSATSFGCIGNRVYTGLGEEEGYYAIPGSHVPAVEKKLEVIIEANRQLEKFHQDRAAVNRNQSGTV